MAQQAQLSMGSGALATMSGSVSGYKNAAGQGVIEIDFGGSVVLLIFDTAADISKFRYSVDAAADTLNLP